MLRFYGDMRFGVGAGRPFPPTLFVLNAARSGKRRGAVEASSPPRHCERTKVSAAIHLAPSSIPLDCFAMLAMTIGKAVLRQAQDERSGDSPNLDRRTNMTKQHCDTPLSRLFRMNCVAEGPVRPPSLPLPLSPHSCRTRVIKMVPLQSSGQNASFLYDGPTNEQGGGTS